MSLDKKAGYKSKSFEGRVKRKLDGSHTFEHTIREVIVCRNVETGVSERVEIAEGRESLREGK
jgi:hypothetical protein